MDTPLSAAGSTGYRPTHGKQSVVIFFGAKVDGTNPKEIVRAIFYKFLAGHQYKIEIESLPENLAYERRVKLIIKAEGNWNDAVSRIHFALIQHLMEKLGYKRFNEIVLHYSLDKDAFVVEIDEAQLNAEELLKMLDEPPAKPAKIDAWKSMLGQIQSAWKGTENRYVSIMKKMVKDGPIGLADHFFLMAQMIDGLSSIYLPCEGFQHELKKQGLNINLTLQGISSSGDILSGYLGVFLEGIPTQKAEILQIFNNVSDEANKNKYDIYRAFCQTHEGNDVYPLPSMIIDAVYAYCSRQRLEPIEAARPVATYLASYAKFQSPIKIELRFEHFRDDQTVRGRMIAVVLMIPKANEVVMKRALENLKLRLGEERYNLLVRRVGVWRNDFVVGLNPTELRKLPLLTGRS